MFSHLVEKQLLSAVHQAHTEQTSYDRQVLRSLGRADSLTLDNIRGAVKQIDTSHFQGLARSSMLGFLGDIEHSASHSKHSFSDGSFTRRLSSQKVQFGQFSTSKHIISLNQHLSSLQEHWRALIQCQASAISYLEVFSSRILSYANGCHSVQQDVYDKLQNTGNEIGRIFQV